MYRAIVICFITLASFLSPGLGQTSDTKLATADLRCVGEGCVQAAPAATQGKNSNADFSPTPVELLVAGIALIAVRMAAKKYLPRKAE